MSTATTVKNNKGNISFATNDCERAMTTKGDIDKISFTLSQLPQNNLPIALREMAEQEINETLCSWKQELNILLDNPDEIIRNNDGGNFADSDLLAHKGGKYTAVEAKFGAHTNAASGINRVNNILNYPAFQIDSEARKEIAENYLDENKMFNLLENKIDLYMEEFIKDVKIINSEKCYDLIKSSGKEGNSLDFDNYKVFTFKQGGIVKEIPLNINKDDEWTVEPIKNKTDNSLRFNYILTSGEKKIKLTYNNKNNNRVKINGEKVKIASKFLTGCGSYNVWFSDGLK